MIGDSNQQQHDDDRPVPRDGGAVPNPESRIPNPDVASGDVAIRVRGLVTRFGEQTVHDGLDLDVYPGEILGVVGGSGSGKSVLMRSIIGLQRPAAGSIRVLGRRSGAGRYDV